MVLLFRGIYGSKVVMLEEDTDVEVRVDVDLRETVKEEVKEMRKLTGVWLEEFSEPWSDTALTL